MDQERLIVAGVNVPTIAGVGTRTTSSGMDWGVHLHPQVLADLVTKLAGALGVAQ
jgi:hypothetical protein